MEKTNRCENCPNVQNLNYELWKLDFDARTGQMEFMNNFSLSQAKVDLLFKIENLKSNCPGPNETGLLSKFRTVRCQSPNRKVIKA